jgi:hypothetical protein
MRNLISDAAEAIELYGEDALEAHADKMRQNASKRS